jgi:mono/diheme cytochrome c family protein
VTRRARARERALQHLPAMKLVESLAAISVAAAAGCGSSRPQPTAPEAVLGPSPDESEAIGAAPTPVDPAVVARGAYVAAIAGCVVCHTPVDAAGVRNDAKRFAGGLEGRGERGEGVWRSANITPDPTTGIGAWTDDEIERAIRAGLSADGSRLYPMMPYPFYQHMSDADVAALIVFLRAQAPVTQRVPDSQGLAMMPVIVPPPASVPEPGPDPLARGEYLANLMHCAACHTPDSGAFANQPFAGGRAFDNPAALGGGTLYAANITSDPGTGIGAWSDEDVIRAVRTMVRPDGTPLRGPMTSYRDAWSALTDADARALAIYVRSIRPVENEIVQAQRQARLDRSSPRTSTP